MVYPRPPIRRDKRTHRPKLTRNPGGLIRKHQSWQDIVAKTYAELGVVNSDRMNVYLVAFLSCWICVFVFSSGDPEFVRPETFKIASIMAIGHKTINLALQF